MRLKLERFGLPNKPSETPAQLEELVRCGDWGRGLPFPLPLIRRQPLSPARRRTAPLTQGSHKDERSLRLRIRAGRDFFV